MAVHLKSTAGTASSQSENAPFDIRVCFRSDGRENENAHTSTVMTLSSKSSNLIKPLELAALCIMITIETCFSWSKFCSAYEEQKHQLSFRFHTSQSVDSSSHLQFIARAPTWIQMMFRPLDAKTHPTAATGEKSNCCPGVTVHALAKSGCNDLEPILTDIPFPIAPSDCANQAREYQFRINLSRNMYELFKSLSDLEELDIHNNNNLRAANPLLEPASSRQDSTVYHNLVVVKATMDTFHAHFEAQYWTEHYSAQSANLRKLRAKQIVELSTIFEKYANNNSTQIVDRDKFYGALTEAINGSRTLLRTYLFDRSGVYYEENKTLVKMCIEYGFETALTLEDFQRKVRATVSELIVFEEMQSFRPHLINRCDKNNEIECLRFCQQQFKAYNSQRGVKSWPGTAIDYCMSKVKGFK